MAAGLNVSPAGAKSYALGCVIGAAAIASVDSLSRGERPPLRIGVGAFVAGLMLLALADVAPQLAVGFGSVVIVGAVLGDGIPAAKRIADALNQ